MNWNPCWRRPRPGPIRPWWCSTRPTPSSPPHPPPGRGPLSERVAAAHLQQGSGQRRLAPGLPGGRPRPGGEDGRPAAALLHLRRRAWKPWTWPWTSPGLRARRSAGIAGPPRAPPLTRPWAPTGRRPARPTTSTWRRIPRPSSGGRASWCGPSRTGGGPGLHRHRGGGAADREALGAALPHPCARPRAPPAGAGYGRGA